MRFLAAWVALHETCAFFQVHDSRVAIGINLVGWATAFLLFADTTSYRSVRPKA